MRVIYNQEGIDSINKHKEEMKKSDSFFNI